jgi:CheY-like chemotaxis protein
MSPRIIPRREKLPIRRILVVDRNEKIGNLFRRSLTNMFGSDCEIVTVQSAAAALQQYSGSDIIIAEERLYKPLKPTLSTSSITPPPPPPPTSLSPSESVPSHLGDTQYMSGSELFARIVADPKQKACVLIGVSTHPLEDGKRFREAGADLVWSKPPPRMDLGLRNELIALVLAKR